MFGGGPQSADSDLELRRTAYDVQAAADAITPTGYPKAAEAVRYLKPDHERPARLSALIEGIPWPDQRA